MNKLVKINSTKKVDGDGIAIVEQYEGDTSEHNIINPPNFESLPLPDDQALLNDTDKRGESVVSGVVLETDITPGEVRIPWTDSSGLVKGSFYFKNNGAIEINSNAEELISLMLEIMDTIIGQKTITMQGPAPLTPDTIVLLTNLKARLQLFKDGV